MDTFKLREFALYVQRNANNTIHYLKITNSVFTTCGIVTFKTRVLYRYPDYFSNLLTDSYIYT